MNDYRFFTLEQRPELSEQLFVLGERSFSKFLKNNDTAQYSSSYEDIMFKYCIVVCDDEDRVLGGGFTVPIEWDKSVTNLPQGYDGAIIKAMEDLKTGKYINTLCGLSVIVSPDNRGQKLSYQILSAMKNLAKECGLTSLIIPVRPVLKSHYPLLSIEDYLRWENSDGSPFDPWLGIHWKMGAKVIDIAHNSMNITGTVRDWEDWSGLQFLQSGEYVIPEALVPINISLEENKGEYIEPNVWVEHPIMT